MLWELVSAMGLKKNEKVTFMSLYLIIITFFLAIPSLHFEFFPQLNRKVNCKSLSH